MYKIMTLFNAIDNVTSVAQKVEKSLNGVEGTAARVGAGMAKAGDMMTVGITAPLLGLGAISLKSAGDFEAAMNIMTLAARDSGTSMQTLSALAIKLGADETFVGVTASSAAEAMTNFYKAGLSTSEIVSNLADYMNGTARATGALASAVDLAAASEMNLSDASTTIVTTMAAFGISAEDSSRIVNNLVKAADASQASVGDLAMALRDAGPVGNAFGFTIEDVNTTLALFSQGGINGAEAGTLFRSMLIAMTRDTDNVTETLDLLGVSLYDAEGNFLRMPEIIGQLSQAMAGLTEEQRIQALTTIAGSRGIVGLTTLLQANVEGWNDMERAIGAAATAQEVAAVRTQGFNAELEAFVGQVETIVIQLGQSLLPMGVKFLDWLQGLATQFSALSPETQANIVKFAAFAAGIGPVLSVGGRLIGMLSSVTTVMKGVPGAFTAVVSAARGLPAALSMVGQGFQAVAAGASLAETASVGSAAFMTGSLIPVIAAVAAVIGVAVVAYQRWQQVQERTQEVSDTWTQFLTEQVDAGHSAAQVADEYVAAQGRVAQSLDSVRESGSRAQLLALRFMDTQKLMVADQGALHDALLQTSTSYDEYLQAVIKVNEAASEMELEERIQLLSRDAYAAQAAAGATDEMADALGGLGDVAPGVQEMLAQLDLAMGENGAAAEEMARRQEEAWVSFQDSVQTGVGEALAAYKAGNTEMLAEQQSALAQMLWNQTDQMVLLGQITAEQALGMKTAIASEYGIMINETQLTTDKLLGMFSNWAAGGDVTADQIVGFLNDIGTQGEFLAQRETETIAAELAQYGRRADAAGSTADLISAYAQGIIDTENDVATSAETTSGRWGTGLNAMGEDMAVLDGNVRRMTDSIASSVDNVGSAVSRLPTEKTITVRMQMVKDAGFEFGSPEFVIQHALESLVEYAAENPVEVNFTDLGSEDVLVAAKKLMDIGGKVSRLGSSFAGMIEKSTLGPMEAKMKGIDDRLAKMPRMVNGVVISSGGEAIGTLSEAYDITAGIAELTNEKVAAEREYARLQEKIARFQEQQQQLDFLKQQIDLLDMVKEYGLDIDQVLGGVSLGLGADVEGLLDAMSRAMAGVIGQTEMALKHPGLSTIGTGTTTTQTTINYNLSYTGMPSNGQPGQMDAERAMREIEVAASLR